METYETFTYLIDGPDEGYVEETAWLRIDQAPTASAAVRHFTQLHHDELGEIEEGLRFKCDARVFLRPELTIYVAARTAKTSTSWSAARRSSTPRFTALTNSSGTWTATRATTARSSGGA